MGQKVNPISFRLGTIFTWSSRWFADKVKFRKMLREDIVLRKFLQKTLQEAQVAKIEIERFNQKIRINIYAAKPGVIIGRGGTGVEELKKKIKNTYYASDKLDLDINVFEVANINLTAELIVQNIALAIEKRVPFRKAVKQVMDKVQKAGALGIRVRVSGRLNGVEIARTENFTWGNLPLHTIRANIDYSRGAAHTTYGAVGVKVWIYKGEVFSDKNQEAKNWLK